MCSILQATLNVKSFDTIPVIEENVDACEIPAAGILNFVTANWSFRKMPKAKKKDNKTTHCKTITRSHTDALSSSRRSDINLSDIFFNLLKGEDTSSSEIAMSSPQMCTNSVQSLIRLSAIQEQSDTLFSTQDRSCLF